MRIYNYISVSQDIGLLTQFFYSLYTHIISLVLTELSVNKSSAKCYYRKGAQMFL